MTDIKLKGGRELDAFLAQLPEKLVRNVMRDAMRAGARVVAKEAKAMVPKDKGDLRRTIKVGARMNEEGQPKGYVTLRGKDAFVGVFMEFGVLPHLISVAEDIKPIRKTRRGERKDSIKTINKKVKRGSLVIGGNFVGPMVSHPGHAARPFLRPALDSKAREAITVIGEHIASRLKIGTLQAPLLSVDEDE